jgi:diacylglycerol kinase family enzyme
VEGDFLFGAVTNSMSVGGIIKLDESQVELNDGLFEVLLIRKPAKGGRLRHIMKGIVNRDFSNPAFEFFKTSKLVIHAEKGLDWTLDGEHAVVEGDTVEIDNINSAISFFVPSDK